MKKIYLSFFSLLCGIMLFNNAGSQVMFSYEMSGSCEPVTIDFYNSTDTSSLGLQGNAIYDWELPSGPYRGYEPPTEILSAGTNKIILTVTDAFDMSVKGSYFEDIYVESTITDFKISSGNQVCPGEQITVWVESDSWWSLDWDFGDGTFKTNQNYANHPVHTYKDPGIYDITLIFDSYCGSDSIVKQINVSNSAVPTVEAFTRHGGVFCPNDPVQFDVKTEFASYQWDFGDGNTSTERRPVHFYETQTSKIYYVSLTVTNSCGQQATDNLQVEFVTDAPAYSYFYWYAEGGTPIPCPNTPIHFQADAPGRYLWDFGDGGFSEEPNPTNLYPAPGTYYVTLEVTNGCGEMAVHTDSIMVDLYLEDSPNVEFLFDIKGIDEDIRWGMDTINVCPGELVKFDNRSYSWSGSPVSYSWDFGDGQTSTLKNPSHVYSGPGVYQVDLYGATPCGGNSTYKRWVHVDAGITPKTNLGVLPLTICDGEEVYFYDMQGSFESYDLIYSIDFGDGSPLMDGIVAPTDSFLMTLANHAYTGAAGTEFISTFRVTNQCNNYYERIDTIRITDDNSVKPFYYIGNSTDTEGNEPARDWSRPHDPSDHQFLIPVSWTSWTSDLDSTFYVYFFYDGFYPEEDPGNPDGYVQFTSSQIVTGDYVTAYVPLDPAESPAIGIVAGWSCDGIIEAQEEPEVWGMLSDTNSVMINSINLVPGGFTDLWTLGYFVGLNPDWDGYCNNEKPDGKYSYEVGADAYVVLDFYDDMYYDLYGSDDPYGNNYLTTFSYGTYSLMSEGMIMFNDEYSCFDFGEYNFTISNGQLSFISMNEYCLDRAKYLDGEIFDDLPDYGIMEDHSACVGDPVQFKIAGGVSYEWHFGDGNTSTEKYPVHTYSSPGEYDAFVVATNSCGRVDTIYTYVMISTTNKPKANFWTDRWDVPRYEPVQFFAEDADMEYTQFYTYEWNFGDGNTSTKRNPIHIYERNGEYIVTLTVTNNCGSNTMTQMFYVQDAALTCQAKFDVYVFEMVATFTDYSWGEASEWFWDFGDGMTSTAQNPTHNYTRDGIYYVCLSVYDENTDCAHQICREVIVGALNCRADFRFTANDANLTVKFTNASLNAVDIFWDFGDGSFTEDPNPQHTYLEPGVYPVYLAIFDPATGCFSEVVKEVQVGTTDSAFCFADFSFFVDTTRTAYFTDESSDNASEWYWTFGDGTYLSMRHPEHIFPHNGLYDVCLIVFDDETGCVAEVCKEVPVGVSACNIRADFAHFIDIDNNTISFNDKSAGTITDWFWNFGDGTTSSRQNPKHTYPDPGFYLVTLSVFNESDDCADHIAEFVQVGSVDCRAAFEYSVDPETNSVVFTNKSKGSVAEYFWFFGDGEFSVEKNPKYTYPGPGLYFAELTVIDSSGLCMDWYFEDIQVGTLSCRAKFNYFIDSTSNRAHFKPEVVGDITDYLWFFGDGSISTKPSPVHHFEQPGYYTVGLNTFNETDGCMDYYEEVILIGAEGIDCRADFIYMADPETYEVAFTDKSKGNIVDYIWEFGDWTEPAVSVKNPTHSYLEGGYYLVCLTVLNNWSIPNTNCKFIQVAPDEDKDCFADFMFTVDSATRTVQFIDESFGNPDSWFWEFGDGKISTDTNPEHTYEEADFYMVHLSTANVTTGCTSHHYAIVNAGEENQGIQAEYAYEIDEDNLKAESYPVDFIGVSLGDGKKLKWDFGDGTTDTTNLNPKHVYTKSGTYVACLTISNPVTGDSDTYCDTIRVGPLSTGSDIELTNSLRIYPNPFEDIATIVFELVKDTEVDLSVFDNAGRKIATLVREYRGSGIHEVEFSRKNLDSGVYHMRLITEDKVITKRMIIR